jgi:hypothetical protein
MDIRGSRRDREAGQEHEAGEERESPRAKKSATHSITSYIMEEEPVHG